MRDIFYERPQNLINCKFQLQDHWNSVDQARKDLLKNLDELSAAEATKTNLEDEMTKAEQFFNGLTQLTLEKKQKFLNEMKLDYTNSMSATMIEIMRAKNEIEVLNDVSQVNFTGYRFWE